MRISFKSFWGETLMLVPNINFWSDDDPEYAPHKYMIFFGWIFWGVRIYFGRREEKGAYSVRIIYNEALDKSYYVIVPSKVDMDSLFTVVSRPYLLESANSGAMTDEQKKAFDGCYELFVDNLHHIAVFSAIEDAFTLRDMLNAISAKKKEDRWKFLPPYRRMYVNRYGI